VFDKEDPAKPRLKRRGQAKRQKISRKMKVKSADADPNFNKRNDHAKSLQQEK